MEKENWFDRILKPNLKQYAEVQLDESDKIRSIQIVNRAVKERGMYRNWYNVRGLNTNELSSINWDAVRKWRPISISEYVLISTNYMNSEDLLNAKLEELKKWRANDVYEQITFQRQSCITLRWVNTYKMINGQKKIKSRLVARGFEENQEVPWTDSPTCAKETLRILLIVIASNNWKCQAIDVKTVFLQSKPIEREVYVIPPQNQMKKII